MPRRKKPLVNDPLAPTKHRVKLPSGKKLTIKRKKAYDKGRFDTQMREQYLALIREGVTNKDAAAACGCGTKYFQRRRKEDPQFEQDYQDARADGDDVIRAEVHRRGVEGVKRAIYHDGKVVGHKLEYSDQLLMFLAKSRMPAEFGDRQQVDHVHKFEGTAETLIEKMATMLGVKPPALPPRNPDVIDAEYTEVDE